MLVPSSLVVVFIGLLKESGYTYAYRPDTKIIYSFTVIFLNTVAKKEGI